MSENLKHMIQKELTLKFFCSFKPEHQEVITNTALEIFFKWLIQEQLTAIKANDIETSIVTGELIEKIQLWMNNAY